MRAALISISLALSQTPAILRDHGYGASVSRGVPVYSPAFAGTHCAYPRRDGQAVLTWVVGYIPRWFIRPQTVTHPSTNRSRHSRVTSLITTNVLTTTSRRHLFAYLLMKRLCTLSGWCNWTVGGVVGSAVQVGGWSALSDRCTTWGEQRWVNSHLITDVNTHS